MKTNLYIVESPLQALNALEISLNKNNDWNGIVYKVSLGEKKRNDSQIEAIIDKGDWDLSYKLRPSKSKLKRKVGHFFDVKKIEKLISFHVDRLYIGEFRSRWMHFSRAALVPKEVWLIDDGAVTLNIIKKYLNDGIYYPKEIFRSRRILKKLLNLILYRQYENKRSYRLSDERIHLISSFVRESSLDRNPSVLVEKLAYKSLKVLYGGESDQKVINDKVLFFGSKLSESNIVSLENEIEMISTINEYYKSRGKKLQYVSHRMDGHEKLMRLKTFLSKEVKEFEDVVELALLKSEWLPSEVAGFYSSALLNVSVIFPRMEITSFKLMEGSVISEKKKDIDNVYTAYRSFGIKVLDL